ncbi:hypothetical protein AB4455_18290 [Vibrio sp. 10N.261.46.E12]|uniref:hypothetical protein n=1 Tax=unclassified Vibrio TaxID=2614977 RepID=UPI0013000060|nr:hypothetical protein [Vibrio sp. 10N.261.45.E2]
MEAIRVIDAVDAVRAGIKTVRKKKLDKERQGQIEAINEKYDRMIEADDFFEGH